MNVRLVLAVLIAAAAPELVAGVRFDFLSEISSPRYSYRGVVLIDGENARVNVTEGRHPMFNPHTSVITRRAGADLIVLDHARKTWFSRQGSRMAGHLGAVRGIGRTSASDPRVRSDREGSVHRMWATYQLQMEVEGEQIDGTVEIEAVSELGADMRQKALPWGLHYAAKTGFEEVDRAITRRMPASLPLRQVVTAKRSIGGGPFVEETITTTVANVTEEEIDNGIFYPPAGYRYEEPVFVFSER